MLNVHLLAVQFTFNRRSKEVYMQVKDAIFRVKGQNNPIREIAKTLGVF